MNNQIKQRVSSRVADYFLVVGCHEFQYAPDDDEDDCDADAEQDSQHQQHHEFSSIHEMQKVRYKAEVLSRYPVEDRSNFPLPAGIPLFCLPNGLQICASRAPTFHSFVHTSEDGLHIMGCCLTIYQSLTVTQRASIASLLCEGGTSSSPPSRTIDDSLFAPTCLCLISHWPFVPSFKAYLRGLYRLSLSKATMTIPIERYICNFIDEVPSPPAGKVDVTYYLGEQSITFRCPPANEPNVWSGLPLLPLFECLSPEHVIALFALVLTERQVIFVSSQYSLLTSCAEAITSLMYPLTWTHAYIPILPRQLLAVLGAPFPFMVGLHTTFLQDYKLSPDAAIVELDKNKISFGSLGPPPSLPDRQGKKLMQALSSSAMVFDKRGADWIHARLPHYDDAFRPVGERDPDIDEAAIRSGFLKFFVAILKNYRRYIIYGTSNDPDPLTKFRFEEFLAEQPADAQPFLEELIPTQMFSQFVDERALQFVSGDKLRDVIFFDESIDAKMNRYTFKLHSIDTPFLLDTADRHAKTYVPPTPNTEGLPPHFTVGDAAQPAFTRKLDESLYSAPRKLPAQLDAGQSLTSCYQLRLKRNNKQPPTNGAQNQNDHDGSHLSALGCAYSCYLVTIALLMCHSVSKGAFTRRHAGPTTQRIIEEFSVNASSNHGGSSNNSVQDQPLGASSNSGATPPRERQNSTTSTSTTSRSRSESVVYTSTEDFAKNIESAKLGLKVCFEVLSSLGRFQEVPDDVVYRSLADACGACGCPSEAIDLLTHMADEGFLPDNQMLAAAARAFAVETKLATAMSNAGRTPATQSRCLSAADIWNTQDWSKPLKDKQESTLYLRKRDRAAASRALATAVMSLTTNLNVPFSTSSPRTSTSAKGAGGALSSGVLSTSSPGPAQTTPPRTGTGSKTGTTAAQESLLRRTSSLEFFTSSAAAGAESEVRETRSSSGDGILSLLESASGTLPPRPPPPTTSSSSTVTASEQDLPSRGSHKKPVGGCGGTPVASSSSATILKSFMTSDGLFPDLQWANLSSPTRKPPFAISKRLNRHMRVAERLLDANFPGLEIDMANPMGMSCPNQKCAMAGKPISISDLYHGFTSPSPFLGSASLGDPNKYTTRCKTCGREFVPRFTVKCDAADWMSNDIDNDRMSESKPEGKLWCELLSPWTLRKEMFNVLFRDGITTLLSKEFRTSSTQRSVVFWNAIISFRLRGLPYAFLLTPVDDIGEAFPLRPAGASESGKSST